MRILLMTVALMSLLSAPAGDAHAAERKDHFAGFDACFLLYNVKTNTFDQTIGGARCQERLPPCSTFKIPLSLMAFDSGVLTGPDQVFKWDGVKHERAVANQDHTPRSWMKDSIVWFSQRLTPQIGADKLGRYLDQFRYGNKNMDAGLTQAWLVAPDFGTPGLRISAYEQVEFMRRLWAGELPVSPQAVEVTKELTFLETTPKGYRIHGKTGSNFYADKRRLGWFIAHVDNGASAYIVVTNISDLHHVGEESYGGAKARQITYDVLKEAGIW